MRVKNWLLYTIFFSCCLCSTVFGQQAIQWQSTLETAKQVASQTNRLVLIHFWSPSCEPCRRMERNVFPQPEVAAAVQANFVAVKLNADQFPATAKQFGVSALPTDIVIRPDGQLIGRSVGSVAAAKYVATLTQMATSTMQPPAAYVQSTIPPQAVAPPQTGPQSAGSRSPIPAGYPNHPYGLQPGTGVAPASPSPPYAVRTSIPSGPPPRQEIAQDVAGAPLSSPVNGTQPGRGQIGGFYQNQPAVPQATGAPNSPTFASSRAPADSASVQAPPPQVASGNPPLGLDGYCPVQLSEKERWVKGNPRWGLIHRGRTYLFAGPEEQSRFYADPDRYAPAYSGADIVVAVEQGQEADGRREHGAWFDGHVYLFSNEESYNRFNADPYTYLRRIQQMAASGNKTSAMSAGRY